jgi:streptogramin lyase
MDDRSSAAIVGLLSVGPQGSGPYGLTAGPDGALWVALEAGSAARIDI